MDTLEARIALSVVAVVAAALFFRRRNRRKAPTSVEEIMAGADPEQIRMMAEDVILLDNEDNVIGHGSKKDTHLNVNIEKGMLHRAFSVFMFDTKGRLLLQKRSSDKITFPSYWANTCCSHPLYMESELDGVDGVKNAARRKLEQELGITPDQVPLDSFQFLTRVHYQARSDEVWGEHEIDYILICTPPKDPVVRRNPNEVAETRYFTPTELREWVDGADGRGDLVSPWFRIIERTLLHTWWASMEDGTLEEHVDDKIHRAGDFDKAAGTAPSVGDASKKQGAYGKVVTHKESVLSQLSHVDEVVAALRYKLSGAGKSRLPADADDDYRFCEEMLCKVSRSFAAVIQGLPEELRKSTCVFYLALRGLDTVEDDVGAFDGDVPTKQRHLRDFYLHLDEADWHMEGVGEGDERALLEAFGGVARTFQALPEEYADVVRDITRRMGEGMARFVDRDLTQGTTDVADYDLYCHYVAGLVGEGLSALFARSGHEDASVAAQKQLSNDMGLFLQKTNIIRDYLEDFVDGRAFWPREIWRHYADDLGAFAHGANARDGLACLNHMVTDALEHAPACLRYMAQLKDPQVFAFCAVPQVMAIATLDKVYNNGDVFTGVVKIRKGLAVKLMTQAKDQQALYRIFLRFARSVRAQVPADDPNAERTFAAVDALEEECLSHMDAPRLDHLVRANWVAFGMLFALLYFLFQRRDRWEGNLPRITNSVDVAAVAAVTAVTLYLLAFCGVPMTNGIVSEKSLEGRRHAATVGYRSGAF
mmetsp:Transcript_18418/g.65217  ORF Transcript_18418/g.65217 Transcript_18418/m.65217 type:complete len:763 (-) Transcript_18418:210-2498(-)